MVKKEKENDLTGGNRMQTRIRREELTTSNVEK
jgi:hypothetical protein